MRHLEGEVVLGTNPIRDAHLLHRLTELVDGFLWAQSKHLGSSWNRRRQAFSVVALNDVVSHGGQKHDHTCI